ncbi:MAG: asparagine synthase (glutamine-hydrolyzing) [Candidatus Sumerlaeota bacterium]|nr:asparagine synthase (glutamine-hydrolyzing) [Candidatus Sumerlaeota bacterium]
MCGICGIIELANAIPDRRALDRMTDLMSHRGPDGRGVCINDNAGLGHRRLSIVDIEGGAQPMVNEDETCVIVFNGEIYNHLDLRRELEGKGYRFRTRCDTEAILRGYEAWGDRCVERLIGMFGFAIWDRRTKSALLARDPLGIKPLYYAIVGGRLVFASEIKSILAYPGMPREINPRALRKFFRYLYVSGEETIFQGIFRVPPGTKMVWSGGQARFEKYWDPLNLPAEPAVCDPREAMEKTNHLLSQAVERRLMSDVPLGAFLSGGLDSSAVVAAMSPLTREPTPTFTIGYSGRDRFINETEYAKAVADHLATEHHEILVEVSALDLLPALIWHLEEPLADSGAILTYIISRFARHRVTVALTGIGGDEVFGGYRRYAAMKLWRLYNAIPALARKGVIEPLARCLPASRASRLLNGFRMLRQFVFSCSQSPRKTYLEMFSAFGGDGLRRLFNEPLAADDPDEAEQLLARCERDDFLAQFMLFDLKTYIPDDLLALADKMSMAVGLEVRVPMLDLDLVRFSQTLPSALKLRGLRRKRILEEAMKPHLPKAIFHRRKQGFSAPISSWLRYGMRDLMEQTLSSVDSGGSGLLNGAYLREMWKAHLSGRQDFSHQLYAALVFDQWRRVFLDSDPTTCRPPRPELSF